MGRSECIAVLGLHALVESELSDLADELTIAALKGDNALHHAGRCRCSRQ